MKKIEQVAIYTPNIDQTIEEYRRRLGLKDWKLDMVMAEGRVLNPSEAITAPDEQQYTKGVNVAKLAFNYEQGFEFELIQYVAGPNWHEAAGRIGNGWCREPFASHMSYHIEDMAGEMTRYINAGFRVAQEVRTVSHTSEHLLSIGRKYHYVIFDSRRVLGYDIKLIKRIEREGQRP